MRDTGGDRRHVLSLLHGFNNIGRTCCTCCRSEAPMLPRVSLPSTQAMEVLVQAAVLLRQSSSLRCCTFAYAASSAACGCVEAAALWESRQDGSGARGRGGGAGYKGRFSRQHEERSKQDPNARRSSRAQRRMERAEARDAAAPVREEIFEVGDEGLSVTDVSRLLAVSQAEVVKTLFMQGIMVQVNQVLIPSSELGICNSDGNRQSWCLVPAKYEALL